MQKLLNLVDQFTQELPAAQKKFAIALHHLNEIRLAEFGQQLHHDYKKDE